MQGWRGWFDRAPCARLVLWLSVGLFAVALALARSPRSIVGLPADVLYAVGMCDALAVFRERRVEMLVTSCFVHASVGHLLLNLYVWREVAPPVERAVGTARMASLALVSGLAGSVSSAAVGFITETERTSEGLSGVLFGVLAASCVSGFLQTGRQSVLGRSAARWLALLISVQLAAVLVGLARHFDHAAHAAAAVAGGALGLLWGRRGATHSPNRAAAAAAVCVLFSFAVLVYRDRTDTFSTLGAADRCDVASAFLRVRRCDDSRSALDAATRLLPGQPAVMALEGEWRRTCRPAAPPPS